VPQFRSLDKQGFPNPYFPELKGVAFLSLDASHSTVLQYVATLLMRFVAAASNPSFLD
jgi:hypothetical protein